MDPKYPGQHLIVPSARFLAFQKLISLVPLNWYGIPELKESKKCCIFCHFSDFFREKLAKTYHEIKVNAEFHYLHPFILLIMRQFGQNLTFQM